MPFSLVQARRDHELNTWLQVAHDTSQRLKVVGQSGENDQIWAPTCGNVPTRRT
jgi:hypothetical protein